VPTETFNKLSKEVGHVNKDCSNRDSLPDVTLTMGGKSFSIESKYYVVKTVAESATGAKAAEARKGKIAAARAAGFGIEHLVQKEAEVCQLAFFAMDEPTNEGNMVILGIPFLRAYAAHLSRQGNGSISLSKVSGSDMCTKCGVGSETTDVANALQPGGNATDVGASEPPSIPLSKLHLPFWLKANTTTPVSSTKGTKRHTNAHRVKRDHAGRIVF
jgi:hypothetical protein